MIVSEYLFYTCHWRCFGSKRVDFCKPHSDQRGSCNKSVACNSPKRKKKKKIHHFYMSALMSPNTQRSRTSVFASLFPPPPLKK
ncbi:hypothetical protein GDO78_022746 [Eleutherodactylus coqui]|uniref:Uncharacterized protein n=1 Tax=Eleutherodactylus coqui TaxID=57060 RepID=A0A8J6EMN0_ELECQ|nr:hypothetical protein GDO78_022746 [Eleutherodactylus coqui]